MCILEICKEIFLKNVFQEGLDIKLTILYVFQVSDMNLHFLKYSVFPWFSEKLMFLTF